MVLARKARDFLSEEKIINSKREKGRSDKYLSNLYILELLFVENL